MPTAKWHMILETLERASESIADAKHEIIRTEATKSNRTMLYDSYPEDDRVVQVGLIHVNIIENRQRA